METLSPYLWDLTHWARTAGWGASYTCSRSPGPWVGARVASPQRSILRPSEASLADSMLPDQHRTNHLLIKPDILTCYQQASVAQSPETDLSEQHFPYFGHMR